MGDDELTSATVLLVYVVCAIRFWLIHCAGNEFWKGPYFNVLLWPQHVFNCAVFIVKIQEKTAVRMNWLHMHCVYTSGTTLHLTKMMMLICIPILGSGKFVGVGLLNWQFKNQVCR